MNRKVASSLLAIVLLPGCSALAQDPAATAPGGDYQKVSELAPLPEFIPGLGTLYVQPSTLPVGPFLGYDRAGNHVNTVYMVPVDDLEAQKGFPSLEASGEPVEFTALHYNAGHPGVEEPHYHVVLWHVGAEAAEALK